MERNLVLIHGTCVPSNEGGIEIVGHPALRYFLLKSEYDLRKIRLGDNITLYSTQELYQNDRILAHSCFANCQGC